MNEIKPILTLNMDDKIYLAVTKKLSFVYTLSCLRTNVASNEYNLVATNEIHAFDDKNKAQIYYNTILQIVSINSVNDTYKNLFKFNEKLIEKFYENTK